MKTKQYIAVNSPTDFYFVELPSNSNASLPGSSYMFVEVPKFIDRIVKHYPGTLRDLAEAVQINPHYLYFLSSKGSRYTGSNPNPPRPDVLSLVDYKSMVALIKNYYTYYLATTRISAN